MTGLYLLEDWTLYEYGDFCYLRGRPVGHPQKPNDRTIMTTQVDALEGGTATTGETVWILGRAA